MEMLLRKHVFLCSWLIPFIHSFNIYSLSIFSMPAPYRTEMGTQAVTEAPQPSPPGSHIPVGEINRTPLMT